MDFNVDFSTNKDIDIGFENVKFVNTVSGDFATKQYVNKLIDDEDLKISSFQEKVGSGFEKIGDDIQRIDQEKVTKENLKVDIDLCRASVLEDISEQYYNKQEIDTKDLADKQYVEQVINNSYIAIYNKVDDKIDKVIKSIIDGNEVKY